MGLYQQLIQSPMPENTLILPLQYQLFGETDQCILFVELEKELGKGTSKRVDQVHVKELIGSVPLPEVASLKDQHIVLYRPRRDVDIFINDTLSIVKLSQLMLEEQSARANVVNIKGHSCYILDVPAENIRDYPWLLYGGHLRLSPSLQTFMKILQSFLGNACTSSMLEQLTKEVLKNNILVDVPFMIAEILPFSVQEAFSQMPPDVILQNVYKMVYTIAAYASSGIYFRDLQPDNFRLNQKGHVKLIDPSYIASTAKPDKRLALFTKQTTPEYLPNVFSDLSRRQKTEELVRYFGEFTEGVCIGMLERVLRRIFLPKYMGEKYDDLYRQYDSYRRIEITNELKFREDLDLFQDVIERVPNQEHFVKYQENIINFMQREGIFSESLMSSISHLLTVLRRFSYPVFTPSVCHTLLSDEQGSPVSISKLPAYIQNLGIVMIEKFSQELAKTDDVIFEEEKKKAQIVFKKPENLMSIPSAIQQRSIMHRDILQQLTTKSRKRSSEDDVVFEDSKTEDVVFDEEDVSFEEDKASKEIDKKHQKLVQDIDTRKLASMTSKPSPQILQEMREVSQFIQEKLPFIKPILHESPVISHMVRKNILKKLHFQTMSDMKRFLVNTNNFFQELEVNFTLERKVHALLSNDICKDLEQHATEKHKHLFRTGAVIHKCNQILRDYLVLIAKSVFLMVADLDYDIVTILPTNNEDVLIFISKYLCISVQEFCDSLALELQNPTTVTDD